MYALYKHNIVYLGQSWRSIWNQYPIKKNTRSNIYKLGEFFLLLHLLSHPKISIQDIWSLKWAKNWVFVYYYFLPFVDQQYHSSYSYHPDWSPGLAIQQFHVHLVVVKHDWLLSYYIQLPKTVFKLFGYRESFSKENVKNVYETHF